MKKLFWICIILLMSFTAFSQQQSLIEQSLVINIEVPVRVFDGARFINDLSLRDFELFEDGTEQKIEAVYLISDRSIERSDERNYRILHRAGYFDY